MIKKIEKKFLFWLERTSSSIWEKWNNQSICYNGQIDVFVWYSDLAGTSVY